VDDHCDVHEQLARAIQPVLRDAETAGVPVPTVADQEWIDFPDMASAMLPSTGVSVALGVPEAEQIAQLADQVQEWIIEELWGGAPTNWPRCPTHPRSHPLRAAVVGGVATWTCPTDGTDVAPIGSLPR
jgi:hypothetical protein